jgi:hypothetical protein
METEEVAWGVLFLLVGAVLTCRRNGSRYVVLLIALCGCCIAIAAAVTAWDLAIGVAERLFEAQGADFVQRLRAERVGGLLAFVASVVGLLAGLALGPFGALIQYDVEMLSGRGEEDGEVRGKSDGPKQKVD